MDEFAELLFPFGEGSFWNYAVEARVVIEQEELIPFEVSDELVP
ncbi:MAG TPA: hypothetical protein VN902_20080 [Candidatus Acidoferrales bacterium]|nr:hypothetical protein [Candidatus Acidoferrales bacterium]